MIQASSDHPGEALRDYAFEELPAGERLAVEQHLAVCGECATELERLRVTTTALRTLADREIPQRIAFVSDRIFEPNWFRRFWNSGAQMSFASACVLAVAIVVSAWHFAGAKATEVRTIVQTASVPQGEINAAVAKAVAQVREQVREEDMKLIRAAEEKRDAEYRNQMISMGEYFSVQQKRLNFARVTMNETQGVGQ